MGWLDYYYLLERYQGDLSRASATELQEAELANLDSSESALELAKEKWEAHQENLPDTPEEVNHGEEALKGLFALQAQKERAYEILEKLVELLDPKDMTSKQQRWILEAKALLGLKISDWEWRYLERERDKEQKIIKELKVS